MKKLRFLLLCAALLALALASPTPPAAEAACYPSCDTYCPGKPASTICGCPQFTDRWCHKATCGSWNRVGVCWYG